MLPIALAALLLSSHCDARLAGRALQSICDDDSVQCPDGSFVSRDSTRNCEFKTCPEFKCCAWVLEPGKYANDKCESGSHVCCRNGEWGCAIPGLESSFMCNGAPTVGPFPDACPCCEPEIMPVCQVGEPQCCGHNGRWACPINIEGTEYNCGGDVLSRLDGPLCILKARDLADVNVAPGYEGGTNMPSASPNDGDAPSKAEVLQAGNEPEIVQAVEAPKAILQAKAVPVPSQTPPSMPTKSVEAQTTELLGPPLRACKGPEIMCWDGSWVKPDPEKDCYTPPCPPEPCCDPTVPPRIRCGYGGPYCCEDGSWTCQSEQGKYTCGDSELVEPPGGDVCKTTVEPTFVSVVEVKCCDPNLEPGQNGNRFCSEGHQCCPDGKWSCSIGDGETFPCGGDHISEGFGKKCPCCDRESEPKCQTGPAACCDDGGWTCPIDEGGTIYDCGAGKQSNPSGIICETGVISEKPCCDQSDILYCLIGSAGCCEDGSWSCPSNNIYSCGGYETKEPSGTICEESDVVLPHACTKEAFICPDGSAVGRDPNNNCEFRTCPEVSNPDARPTGSLNEREKMKEEKEAERQKKREEARDKKEAERLKRQEEKAVRQKERDEAKAQKEKERAKRQEEAAKKRAEAKATRDAERAKPQEAKAVRERGKDSQHEQKPREED